MSIEKTRPLYGGHGDRGITVLLKQMHDVVAHDVTAQERLDQLTRIIANHVVADVCSIYLRRPDDQLELFSTAGLDREAVHQTRLTWGEGLVGMVANSQRPIITENAPAHPAFAYRPETGEDPLKAFLGVPLIRSGQVIGVLVLQNVSARRYGDDEVGAAQAVATLLAEIAASGELLSREETEAVDKVVHRPELLTGTGVVPGIAIGKASLHEAPIPKYKVFAENQAEEAKRLEDGLERLRSSVDRMITARDLKGVSREVLETYRLFAYDRGWKDRLRTAVFSGLSAEAAVLQVKNENRTRMLRSRDPYLRERMHDLDDLANRLLRILSGESPDMPRPIPDNAILFAQAMGPADLLEYDHNKLIGIVLAEATDTSHVAIVARALNIPVLGGLADAFERVEENDAVVMDGTTGELHIRPGQDVLKSYQSKSDLQSEEQARYAKERHLPCVTQDGQTVTVMMNAGLVLDMPQLGATGAAGVGLFRTELQFLIGRSLPSVEKQEALYREVMDFADGRPVIFRTADLGGDKSADYMKRRKEGNPAMGWRGLRMAVDRPGLLRPQLRALLSATAGRDLHVMFPMVTLASEIDAARDMLDLEIQWHKKRGRPYADKIHIGVMIETPAIGWQIDHIAQRVDFLSIGGNDLAQFFFAADRDTPWVTNRYDPLNPGFLSFIRWIVERARKAGIAVSYCGEQISDRLIASALIGIGVHQLSVAATTVGPLRRLVRQLDAGKLSDWMDDNLDSSRDSLRTDLANYLRRERVL
ncbi:MAG: phosphoenolpyruvate--protein phosphotransferase [Pseudomonadota bacterium]